MSFLRRIQFGLVGLVGIFAVLQGCECDETGDLGATRHLEAKPKTLTFDVLAGETQEKTVRVSVKEGYVRIESIKLIRGKEHYTLVKDSIPELPKELTKGDSFVLKVQYKAPEDLVPLGTIRIQSDATIPREGKLDIQLLSQINKQRLVLDPNPVAFGELQEGKSKEVEVVGENTGRADLVIEKVELDDKSSKGYSFPDGLPKPMTLKPGASFKFKVKYEPTPESPDFGAVKFTCKGGCSPADPDPSRRKDPFLLQLQGKLAAPTIVVTPKLIDFGFVPSGKTETKTFRIENQGSAKLKISEMGFKAGSSGAFIMPTIKNVEIEAGRRKEVAVQYRPGSKSLDEGTIEIKNNDPDRPVVLLPVRGQVSAPDIDVAPKQMNFGKVPVMKKLGLTISNAGDQPLVVQPPTFAQGTSPEFAVENPKQITIQPNKFQQIFVIYKPTDLVQDLGKLLLKSNDPDEPVKEVIVKGQGSESKGCDLLPNPSRVNFGLGVLGRTKTIPVVWTNQGSEDCTVTRIQVTTERGGFPPYTGPDVFNLPAYPKGCPKGVCNPALVIQPGNSVSIDVSFYPLSEKVASPLGKPSFDGQLIVTSNTKPANRVAQLTGLATKSCVEVVPDNVDFGLITVNCSSRNEKINIYNTCPKDLTVSKIGFSAAGSNGFRIARAQRTPFTIPSGQTAQIELAYRATAPARKENAVLEIEHSVTQQSPLSVPLIAQGTTTADQTDKFEQAKSPQVDILFVIDDSGSMGDNQRDLANNFTSFIQWAQTLKVDFQIGIITTDVGGTGNPFGGSSQYKPGELRGNPKILTNNTPNLTTVFRQNALVGTQGSAQEQGLEASRLALSHPLATTGNNKGFLRKQASLSIIVVSDEPDSSGQPVQYYINFLRNIKGVRNPDLLRFNAVIGYEPQGKKPQCPAGGQPKATSKGRYVAVTQATNGVAASICNSNWAGTLSAIGAVTFGLRKSFYLTRVADPKSILVKIDGKTVPASDYTYDPVGNTVTFKKAPGAGSKIEVNYKALCF